MVLVGDRMSDHQLVSPTTVPLDDIGGRALVEAWRTSGLTGAAYCREHNIRVQKLHYWRERLGYPIRTSADADRLPMTTPAAPAATGFVQVMVAPPPVSATTDVAIVVGGAIIRVRPGFDAVFLRSVIAALSTPC